MELETKMVESNKTDPVRVTVQMGFTRNMGNFESMRIDIGVEAPALSKESTPEAFDRIYAFVEKKLLEKFSETEEQLSEAGLGEDN